ncbi:MAG: hypothetical protein AB7V58_00805 [Solirubrobacterales bacterium]
MHRQPALKSALALTSVILAAWLLAGCGGGSEEPTTKAAPKAASFPAVKDRTLEEVGATIAQANLVASPAGQVFDAGENRYAFGVFTKGKKPVDNLEAAVYFAQGKTGTAIGPYPATPESLQTPPAFRAETTSQDPGAATVVYVVPRSTSPPQASGERSPSSAPRKDWRAR